MMNRWTFNSSTSAITVVLIAILSTGCEKWWLSPMSNDALAVEKAFATALVDLKEETVNFNATVTEAVDPAKQELSVDSVEVHIVLPAAAQNWEARWSVVERQTDRLEDRFYDLKDAADKHFDKLTEVSSSIKDQKLRADELRKNKIAKEEWDAAFEVARFNIRRARDLQVQGSDFHKVLLGAALRNSIQGYIQDLNQIADEARELIKELESLIDQGEKLV